jgi:hypothetical protein
MLLFLLLVLSLRLRMLLLRRLRPLLRRWRRTLLRLRPLRLWGPRGRLVLLLPGVKLLLLVPLLLRTILRFRGLSYQRMRLLLLTPRIIVRWPLILRGLLRTRHIALIHRWLLRLFAHRLLLRAISFNLPLRRFRPGVVLGTWHVS